MAANRAELLRIRLASSRWAELAVVALAFLLCAVIFTWPLVLHVKDGVAGDAGDPLLNAWILSWDAKTLFSNPSHLFQANMMYPSRDVLVYSEHMLAMGLLAAPLYHLTHNPILCYNFLVFLAIVLSGLGCYLLLVELTESRWAGLVAGLFFALCPYKISKLTHLHVFFAPFLPFMCLYLYRFLKRGGARNVILFGFFFLLQALSSWHYLVFCLLAALVFLLWQAIFSRAGWEWRRILASGLVMVVALLCVFPLALPYLRANRRLPGFVRTISDADGFAANKEDYLTVLPHNLLYAEAGEPFYKGGIGSERVLYPGLTILMLAVACVVLRKKREDAAPAFEAYSLKLGMVPFLLLGAVGLLLSFGPHLAKIPNIPYYLLYRAGLVKFIRVPARFNALVIMSLAVLGGYGTAKLAARAKSPDSSGRSERLVTLGVCVLLFMEALTFNLPVVRVPTGGDVPRVYRWLKEQGDVKVIELPTYPLKGAVYYDRYDLNFWPENNFEFFSYQTRLIYYSTYHWKKTVNGFSGYFPPFYKRILTEAQGFPSPRTVSLLKGLGIRYVVWNWDLVPLERKDEYNVRLFSTPGVSMVEDFGSHSVFELEEGEISGPEDLGVELEMPEVVPPGRSARGCLLVSNRGRAPWVCAEEEPQRLMLRYLDGAGNLAGEEAVEFRAPIFLESGETAQAPFRARLGLPPGDYRVEAELSGGVLGTRAFERRLSVAGIPASDAPSRLNAVLSVAGEDEVGLAHGDGLLPLRFKVRNDGDTWMISGKGEEEEKKDARGVVFLSMKWKRGEETVWEVQMGTLPCDLAPGQEVLLPTLVRVPQVRGEFRVTARLSCVGYGPFGEEASAEVAVEGRGL